NPVALRSYLTQLRGVSGEMNIPEAALLGQILALPGVVPEPGATPLALEEQWPVVEGVLEKALAKLQAMRQEEGRAMAHELLQHRNHIADHLDKIRQRAPAVVETYRDKLHERVRKLLGQLDVEIDKSDLIKEVSIFAERSDIAEEVVRLASH